MKVHLDFETQSAESLKKVGARLYAEHESTQVICLAYAVDNGPVYLLAGQDLYRYHHLLELVNGNALFCAHNAAFEQAIWSVQMAEYGYPSIPIERWRCTMAKAYAMGLPGSLEKAALALSLEQQKDMEGANILRKLSSPKPKSGGRFYDAYDECPAEYNRLYEYCIQDVRTERELDNALRDLSDDEQEVWFVDQRINQRGLRIDLPLVRKAIAFKDQHKANATEKFRDLMGLNPTQRDKVKAKLQEHGIDVKDMKGSTLAKVLAREDLDDQLRRSIELYGEANKLSLAKYQQMLNRSNDDGIIRETLVYHGAHTGRWAGRGVQFQNLPRGTGLDMELAGDCFLTLPYEALEDWYGDITDLLKMLIRGAVIPSDDCRLMAADLAQMEARVLAWLAGQQDVLDRFANGEDIYCVDAATIFGHKVTKQDKNERQVGKVSRLALGYQGGIGAYAAMAETYRVDLRPIIPTIWHGATHQERDDAERSYMLYLKRDKKKGEEPVSKEIGLITDIIKQRWRADNPHIVAYWKELETCIVEAIKSGKPVTCGQGASKIIWFTHGSFLFARLPSGRFFSYPFPKLEIGTRGKVTISYRYVDLRGNWVRGTTYGGSIAENLTQAVQRDLLSEANKRLEASGYRIILHAHDETIADVPNDYGSLEEFLSIFREAPPWSLGIPINAEGWTGKRYRKE